MGIGEGKRKGVARFYEVLLVQELHRIFEEGLVRCDGLLPEFRPLWLKRRLRAASLPEIISPHSFHVLVVTDQLSQNLLLEDI